MNPRLKLDRGATVSFADLPPCSIALDGYVQGPAIDTATRRFSFDHHDGCIRHATLATCEMTLDALRVGLDPSDLTVFVNDLDPDTIASAWLLLYPAAASVPGVAVAIHALGRLDALGPSVGVEVPSALRWALGPYFASADAGQLRQPEGWVAVWELVLAECFARLNNWLAAGAPSTSPAMPASEPRLAEYEVLFDGGTWQLLQSPAGLGAFAAAYSRGVRAAVVARELGDGTTEYTVGKASEFVSGFDVPAILAALAAAEREVNPAQDPARNWGGGTTIGGSPRNADGSGSRLRWSSVVEVVRMVCGRSDGR